MSRYLSRRVSGDIVLLIPLLLPGQLLEHLPREGPEGVLLHLQLLPVPLLVVLPQVPASQQGNDYVNMKTYEKLLFTYFYPYSINQSIKSRLAEKLGMIE